MAVFLASEESRMVTGHVYPVDSGVTIFVNGRARKTANLPFYRWEKLLFQSKLYPAPYRPRYTAAQG
jgi:hypothetical protein